MVVHASLLNLGVNISIIFNEEMEVAFEDDFLWDVFTLELHALMDVHFGVQVEVLDVNGEESGTWSAEDTVE